MKNESLNKSLEKSKNVLEEKLKIVKQKFCIKKTNTLTIIAMNFVQEQIITLAPSILSTSIAIAPEIKNEKKGTPKIRHTIKNLIEQKIT